MSSTIGYERAHNALLREPDVERFVERSLATLGPQPPNFQAIVALNRGPLLGAGVEATPLTPREVQLWSDEGRPVAKIERLPADELEARRAASAGNGETLQVLDASEQREWDAGHIPGSVHMPYHDIDAVPAGVDPALPVAVVCESGQRAAVAASLLARYGARAALHVVNGGVGTWERAGGVLESVA